MKIILGAVSIGVLAGMCACSSSSNPTTTGGTGGGSGDSGPMGGGTVPADMRDVEREGEGLVIATFGPYPDRKPDWNNAVALLSLLKQVWGRSKTASPGLPATQVKMLDDAIATLDVAIPAQDQQKAVYASNAVGLAVPELFDFFHPDAPIGVVRMDAVYRQLGLDAHYGKFAEVKTDLDSLKSDWNNTKGPVGQKVPTCSRVGGTATVSSDIDESLAAATAALGTMDPIVVEQESEKGAGQIDILELLFDCPAGTAPPATGVGKVCKATADCDRGLVCDLAWMPDGRCAPDVANAKVGTACTTTIDCGSDSRSACLNEPEGYKGGYCTMEPCNDAEVCSPGATCVSIPLEAPGCLKSCTTDADCRMADGYVCQLFALTPEAPGMPPRGYGPSDHACRFPCTADPDCNAPFKCDIASGKCTP